MSKLDKLEKRVDALEDKIDREQRSSEHLARRVLDTEREVEKTSLSVFIHQ